MLCEEAVRSSFVVFTDIETRFTFCVTSGSTSCQAILRIANCMTAQRKMLKGREFKCSRF